MKGIKSDWGNVPVFDRVVREGLLDRTENSSSGEQSQGCILGKGWMAERGDGAGESMEDNFKCKDP